VEKKKQHIIPSCYLKAWCDPGTPHGQHPFVWRIKKDGSERKRKSPEKSFTATDKYTMKFPDGERNLIIEDTLAGVEDAFVRVLKRIERRENLDASDRARLCLFTAAMHTRTIAMGERMRDFLTTGHNQVVALENKRNAPPGTSLKTAKLAENAHPLYIAASLRVGTPLLFKMAMTILASDDEFGFITSDIPCVWFSPSLHTLPPSMRNLGLNLIDIEVTLPLSPRYLILFSHHRHPVYVDVGQRSTDELNRRARLNCAEEFVSWKGETRSIWFDTGKEPEDAWEKTEEGKRALEQRDRMMEAKKQYEQWLEQHKAGQS
jgi:hypothetical protein